MNMNDWDPRRDPRAGHAYPPGYPPSHTPGIPMAMPMAKKRKWLAGLLAFFVPGTGHFYLGLMIKGIAIMLLMAMDICAIVFAATQIQNVLVIVLLSLLMPIIYFYNLFDAIQSTDHVNGRYVYTGWTPPARHFEPMGPPPQSFGEQPPGPNPSPQPPQPPFRHPAEQPQRSVNRYGVLLLAAGAVVLLMLTNGGWADGIFRSSGSMVGAVVLICAGIGLWFWELRDRHGKNS